MNDKAKCKNCTFEMIEEMAEDIKQSLKKHIYKTLLYPYLARDMFALGYRKIPEGSVVLDRQEHQQYCAYKIIEPQIKGCLDRERELERKLKELEDKIENSTLIECKVDGIVYFVSKKKGIQWSVITEMQVLIDRYTRLIQVKDDDYKWHTVNNNTVFLTKAEAEKKLKELKGE